MRFALMLFTLFLSFYGHANVDAPSIDLEALAQQKSYIQMVDCRAPKQLTHLLEQSLKDTDNLATKGKSASVLEEVMMNNPDCFIQALNDLPPAVCSQIEQNFIQETFFYPRSELRQALSNAKSYRNSCIAS